MVRRGLFLCLFILLIGFGLAGPMGVEGIVRDVVTGNPVDNPNVYITCSGFSTSHNRELLTSEFLKPNVDGGYNFFDCSSGSPVTIRAEYPGYSNCYGEKTFNTNGVDNLEANIDICCQPNKATGLEPSGTLHITEPTSIDFSWNAGSRGNIPTEYDAAYKFWEKFSGAGVVQENAISPITKIVSGLSGWSVTSCNGNPIGGQCCVSSSSNPNTNNDPCPAPTNLKGTYNKEEARIVTSWSSVKVDSEGDACHDVWRAKSLAEGDQIDSPSWTSGEIEDARPGQEAEARLVTIWEVKSCDVLDACSAWVQAITPSCNEVSRDCPTIKSCYDSSGSAIPFSSGVFGDEPIGNINVGDREIPLRMSYIFLVFGLLFMTILSFVLYKEYRSQSVSEFGV